MNQILIDSSFLGALYNPVDRNRPSALNFIEADQSTRLIPEIVLPEVAFLLNRAGGIPAVAQFLQALVIAQPTMQNLLPGDLNRARDIMLTYASARFDLVDCCIMALVERLNITQVATFDRRDFSIFRLPNGEYLELLP